MEYIDPYNFPELAIREYDIVGGSVIPDLFHGTIFRMDTSENFTIGRLRNQIDGAKFFMELYNPTVSSVTVSFNTDWRGTNLVPIVTASVSPSGIVYYEGVCRLGVMLLYNVTGVLPTNALLNPLDGSPLLNPKTGDLLLNPKQ